MPPLPDDREEQFCREVASSSRIVEAYTMAGLPVDTANGYRRIKPLALALIQRADVSQRIKELRVEFALVPAEQLEDDSPELPLPAPTQEWTREQLVWQYERIKRTKYHVGKAIRVLHLLGIANGLFKAEHVPMRDDFEHMNEEELHAAVAAQRARLDELAKAVGPAGRAKANGKANGEAGAAGVRKEPGRVH
jgi:hypothetical protein